MAFLPSHWVLIVELAASLFPWHLLMACSGIRKPKPDLMCPCSRYEPAFDDGQQIKDTVRKSRKKNNLLSLFSGRNGEKPKGIDQGSN